MDFTSILDLFGMEIIPLINDVVKDVFVWRQSPVSIDAFMFRCRPFPPFFLTFIVICSFNRFLFRMIFLHELGLSSLNKIVINLSVIVVAMSMISFILQRHFTKIYQFLSHNPCLFSSIFFRLFDLLFHHFFFSTSSSFFFFNNS